MLHLLIFAVGLVIGVIIGIIIISILTAGSNSDDIQEAYNRGFKDGKDSILEKVNNLYDKYKNEADEHTDIRC